MKEIHIDKSIIHKIALERHASFWFGKEIELDLLIEQSIKEIKLLNRVADRTLSFTPAKANKIKAIWAISGSGTYTKSITNVPGDQVYRSKIWGQWSDKKRIDHSLEIIQKISTQNGGFYPYLIYNGITEQVIDLKDALQSDRLDLPKDKLFIPTGMVIKTIDQVKGLSFPRDALQEGDVLGIVSHSPHLARVMRMVNKFRSIPLGVSVQLFPMTFNNIENDEEFAFNEILGIIGYISRGEATIESYPYDL